MKKYFCEENIVTFVIVALACAAAITLVVPLARKFIPSFRSSSTVTPPATT
jgi:hypothetical protein